MQGQEESWIALGAIDIRYKQKAYLENGLQTSSKILLTCMQQKIVPENHKKILKLLEKILCIAAITFVAIGFCPEKVFLFSWHLSPVSYYFYSRREKRDK